jgi:alpha-mannosidase
MKLIKQKNQEYVGYDFNPESIVDGIIYNTRNRRMWRKKLDSGSYYRTLSGVLPIWEKLMGYKGTDFKGYFIAQSHCDAAWLWPQVDTKIRIYKTFYKALEYIEQFPYFKFAQTSPQYYQWIKAYSPKLWEKTKEQVKKGRFEPVGGMWIEPDLDLPWGESLVRQRLYGQLFYLREFGQISKVESLLDVFGFCWSLPQILVKSGAEFFWTTKMTWNDMNPWPISNYMWRGVDGTEIFTHQFRFHMMASVWMADYYKTGRLPLEGYKKEAIGSYKTNAEIEALMSKERTKDVGLFYGWGDGARGPWEFEIGLVQLLAQRGYGKFIGMYDFFKKIRKEIEEDYLVWNDEMYLEFHRGCKTTQLEIKHYNRKAEMWAYALETLVTSIDSLYSNAIPYDKAEMFEMWRRILFNQFHDILPGSSIPDVYIVAVKEQKDTIKYAQDRILRILNAIPTAETDYLVFNPTMWPRSEYVQLLWDNTPELHYCENIPPLSVTVLNRNKTKVPPPSEKHPVIRENDFVYILENPQLKAEIDKDSGALRSLVYKPMQMELIDLSKSKDHRGSGFRVYREQPRNFPAWNIDKNYWRHPVDVIIKDVPKITTQDDGTHQITVEYKFLRSTAKIHYYLRPLDRMLQIKIHTDVKDPKILVKYFIPLNLKSEDVTAEIPYASISRKRVPHTERQRAKWEMPMQKWIDISEKTHGLTILNDNRYGFSSSKNGIYLTLTRTPKYPSPGFYSTLRLIPKNKRPKYTDLKPFNYEFGLLPHMGSWKDAHTWQEGYNFNLPLITNRIRPLIPANDRIPYLKPSEVDQTAKPTPEPLPTALLKDLAKSVVTCDKPNILLGAYKPTEWTGPKTDALVTDDAWTWNHQTVIMRLIEQEGVITLAKIQFNPGIIVKAVEETDLLERPIQGTAKLAGNGFTIDFNGFEIKTVKITLQAKASHPIKK